jgi:hypothetical protein
VQHRPDLECPAITNIAWRPKMAVQKVKEGLKLKRCKCGKTPRIVRPECWRIALVCECSRTLEFSPAKNMQILKNALIEHWNRQR